MTRRAFVHLHCHTHYSLLDGASRIPDLVQHVKKLGMNAVAMTDHGTLSGAIEFYRECKGAGLNPVIGYEAYVAPGKRSDRNATRSGEAGHHLTLLAKNRTGFKNLIKMASVAYLEGFHYKPRIDKELLEAHSEGLICLSGCAAGEFSDPILKGDLTAAQRVAEWFHKLFRDDFYIEIQNNGLTIQKMCMDGAVEIANRMGLPLVATSDAHYLNQADAYAHDVLLCINTGRKLTDEKRLRYGNDDGQMVDQFFVRGPQEMYKLFPEHAEAVQRSQEIADAVDIDLTKDMKARHFPVFTPPAGKTPEDYLREMCQKGLLERYRGKPPEAARQRLEHELNVICRMGFASYFLIVGDFVNFAVENGIPASARGSACGALVSYVLKLTHVDPLEYELLFERFLDPNRGEAPDIDIDFCQNRRDEVIQYVKRKYGEASVAQISTFATLGAKAVIKDVGRVMDMPLDRVNKLTSLVPQKLGITLEDALKSEPELKREYDTDADVKRLIDIALKLEGTNRQAGIHAAGVVISDGPLTDHVPLQRALRKGDDGGGKNSEVAVATQWVMGDLEKVGLLKMDFLGLRTLTLLDNAVKLIEKTHGEKIDVYNLPLDDPETYALLQRGDAKGVFQFESDGIRELLKRLKPDNIHDIIACTALFRPGPMQGGMHDAYVNRKHGREAVRYMHPVMEEVLSGTFNIMVFQEQVMLILNKLGGIELSSAYACIKAISKKKHDVIDHRRAEFIGGAQERGLDRGVAEEIFELIVHFGGYGFNKSHSAAYAVVSYQTAYLKAHYTPEFTAALLSSEVDDGNKRDIMVEHIADAKHLGVEVLAPDVNASEPDFTVTNGKVLFGLIAIKGMGRGASEELVHTRSEGGPFKDFFDLCERVDHTKISKAALEKLIQAGACDRFGNRNQLMTVLPRALQAGAELQSDRRKGQRNLFEAFEDSATTSNEQQPLPNVSEWPNAEKLKYEKEALDFYFSSHPLADHEAEIRRFATHSIAELKSAAPGQDVVVGGMLTDIRFKMTKKMTKFARLKVEDLTGAVDCVMWSDDLARHKDDVTEDRICFVRGTIDDRSTRDEPTLVLNRVMSVETAQREFTRGLWLKLTVGEHEPTMIDAIARILQRSPGNCWVFLGIFDAAGKCVRLKLGEEYKVNPQNVSVGELETLLGAGCVKFAGTGGGRTGK